MSPTRYVDQAPTQRATRVVVQVLSTPAALRAHIEWAVACVLGDPVELDWQPQGVEPGSWRAELTCTAQSGTAAAIASGLAGWGRLRFEVTELPVEGARSDESGLRWSCTPDLGLFSTATSSTGDIVVHEDKLRSLLADDSSRGEGSLRDALGDLLGQAWDAELEPFRAGVGHGVRWLTHRVS